MGTSALYQSIELLSQEKGIDPGIVVGAVEEAIALARASSTRRRKTCARTERETGAITHTFTRPWLRTRSRSRIR